VIEWLATLVRPEHEQASGAAPRSQGALVWPR